VARKPSSDNRIVPQEAQTLFRLAKRLRVGLVCFDPLIEFHDLNESDNGDMHFIAARRLQRFKSTPSLKGTTLAQGKRYENMRRVAWACLRTSPSDNGGRFGVWLAPRSAPASPSPVGATHRCHPVLGDCVPMPKQRLDTAYGSKNMRGGLHATEA
jgi:hypothetical protein